MGQCIVREMGLHSTQWSESKKEKLMMHLKIYREREYKIKRLLDEKRQETRNAINQREREIDKLIRKIKTGEDSQSQQDNEYSRGTSGSRKESSFANSGPAEVIQQEVEYDEDEDIRNDIQEFNYIDDDNEEQLEGEQKFNTDDEPSFLQHSQQMSSNNKSGSVRRIEIDDDLLGYNQEVAKYFSIGQMNNQPQKQIQNQYNGQGPSVKPQEKIVKKQVVQTKKGKPAETPKNIKKNQTKKEATNFQEAFDQQSQISVLSQDDQRDPTQHQKQDLKNFNNPVFTKPADESIHEYGNVFSDQFEESFSNQFPDFGVKK